MGGSLFGEHRPQEPPGQRSNPSPSKAEVAGFVRVAPERAIDLPDGLTYAIPPELADLQPGHRVLIPLGRGNSSAPGIVLERLRGPLPKRFESLDSAQPVGTKELEAELGVKIRKIKPIIARAPGGFPAHLVPLARWLSRYYACPIGMVLAAMQPASVKKSVGQRSVTLIEPTGAQPLVTQLTPSLQAAWEALRARPADAQPLPLKEFRDELGLKTTAPLNKLIKMGILRERTEAIVHARWASRPAAKDSPHPLTEHQAVATDAVIATLGSFAPHLLFGITGSGKTEVYLSILQRVIERDESAIVLVPEISLTPQTAGRFQARFAAQGVAVLHSGLTPAQRHQEWNRVAKGLVRVVVGARSAIFAPLSHRSPAPSDDPSDPPSPATPPLGLIIVDEEHDASYKQDQAPRYHARDVAIKRAQLAACPVLLGSATPSLESWHNAVRQPPASSPVRETTLTPPRYSLLTLPERVAGARLPRVEVVDLNAERQARTTDRHQLHAIGPTLERALTDTIAANDQAILLLNRRGYAHYLACPDPHCAWVLECDHCDATLVEHRAPKHPGKALPNTVKCHHCLAERIRPSLCPTCGKKLTHLGFGTQRVEEELARKFPSLVEGDTLLRLDSDSMRTAEHYFGALERFAAGQVRVLLGTQMIAKGLDFPSVTLVGVINADTAINLPDFRAAERTFQLVAQVAGRAGRSLHARAARVIVQTMNPQEPAIRAAARHDFPAFAQRELADRTAAALPPVARMARIVTRDPKPEKAEASAWGVYRAATGLKIPSLIIRSPAPCAFSRLNDHYRWSVDLHAPSPAPIQNALAALRTRNAITSDAHMTVDVDPIALL
ncbi:MAG: replication restart helicase PriA [Phycisphaerales bacterium]